MGAASASIEKQNTPEKPATDLSNKEKQMNKYRTFLLAIGGCIAVTATNAGAAQGKPASPAESAAPLTAEELFQLYNSRSWLWDDGAGYFSPKQRRFTAWAGKGGKASYADGRWFISGPGKLCFKAKWHAKDGAASAVTCFSHRKKGGIVFQKREPDGEWYAFKNSPAKAGDEYSKVRSGNYVRKRYDQIEARLSAGK
jgi:Protein of unknown function (DUF995)